MKRRAILLLTMAAAMLLAAGVAQAALSSPTFLLKVSGQENSDGTFPLPWDVATDSSGNLYVSAQGITTNTPGI